MSLTRILHSKLAKSFFPKIWISYLRRHLNRLFGGYILAFHSDISIERYREQIQALSPDRPVSLSELVDRCIKGRSTAGLFAITVDDGCRDQVLGISRAAAELKHPVTFYLPTNFINGKSLPGLIYENITKKIPPVKVFVGGHIYDLASAASRNRFFSRIQKRMYCQRESAYISAFHELIDFIINHNILTEDEVFDVPEPVTWDEVSRLSRSDHIAFESHGVTHQAVSSLTEKEIEAELVQSKDQISAYSGREVNHFCYPYGTRASIGRGAPQLVARHYKSAVTLGRRRIRNTNPFELPRIPLYEKDDQFLTAMNLLRT